MEKYFNVTCHDIVSNRRLSICRGEVWYHKEMYPGIATVPYSILHFHKIIIEPGTPPASRIFETINKFVKFGIKCCVNIDPIIPFITDCEQQIRNIVNKCQQSGLGNISGSVLRLRYDIWSRIREVLELIDLSWAIKEYKQIFGFQEPILHENNLTADERYTDKVMSNLKYEILNRNIEFGFENLIAQIARMKQGCPVSLQQCRISEFL